MNTVHEMDKRIAEAVGVKLNILLNNALLFGPKHPSTTSAASTLGEILREQSNYIDMVTFLKNGDSFYIEKWSVDERINSARTQAQFMKTGIESISFKTNVLDADLAGFISIYMTALEHQMDSDGISMQLNSEQITTVLINYITLKKVTREQEIVASGSTSTTVNVESSKLNTHMLKNLEKFFSLNDIINHKGIITKAIDNSSSTEQNSNALMMQFAHLKQEVKESQDVDYDQLFANLVEVSSSLKQGNSVESRLQRMGQNDTVINEVEQLTLDTMVQIIKKEYLKGKTSPDKIARLIRQVSTSQEEIRKLFPYLKQQLLSGGVSLSFFIDLSKELEKELSNSLAFEKIFSSAEDFGIERDELLEIIYKNPSESAKLLFQAAELENMGKSKPVSLSEHISKMIGDISSKVAESSTGNQNDEKLRVTDIVKTVEKELLNKLRENGQNREVIADVEKKLVERFPETLEKIKTEWVINVLGNAESMTKEDILSVINQVSDNKNDVDSYKDTVKFYCRKFNISEDELTSILASAKSKKDYEELRKSVTILTHSNTVYFLKRHIEEFKRHKHPFSIVAVTGKVKESERSNYSEWVAVEMGPKLRFLDIIGEIKVRDRIITVLIFPMTDSEGVATVMERFGQSVIKHSAAVSTVTLDKKSKTNSYEELMKEVIRNHIN